MLCGFVLLSCYIFLSTAQTYEFEPSTVLLYAGRHHICGVLELSFSPDGTKIQAEYKMDPGWTLSEINLDFQFSQDLFPKTRRGNIKVGKLKKKGFACSYYHVQSAGPFHKEWVHMHDVPSSICGQTLYIAAHAIVKGPTGKHGKIKKETAWADPQITGKGKRSWGGLTTVKIVCPDEPVTPGPAGDLVDGCETSWARYMADDKKVTRSTFKAADIARAWGWFQCTKLEGTYQSTMIAAQFYATGTMFWTYTCTDGPCRVEINFQMSDTCGLGDADQTSIQELQVRVGIVTTEGDHKRCYSQQSTRRL